jgi:hypothetical protein
MKLLPHATIAIVAALLLWLMYVFGIGLLVLLGIAVLAAAALLALPIMGVRGLDHLLYLRRAWTWREDEGRYHAFEGTGLAIDDDGRDVWVAGAGLQKALRTTEPDDAFAARHPERWYRDAGGRLWIRVDAVVERLATMPGRDDPRIQRLRRYFEREVLFPAAERRRRRS